MAVAINSFDDWLLKKLRSLNTDEGIFGSYIKGILESDDSEDEKNEALQNLLSSVTENDTSIHVSEILSTWIDWLSSRDGINSGSCIEDMDVRLARMLELQSIPTITQRNYTDEERRIRETILAQYSQTSAEGKSDEEDEEKEFIGTGMIEKNTNVANIIQQEKEKREKAKLDSQKKKEKDKEDRMNI
ncbi:coiled-coil domain-containing protein 43 isoform X2 [Chelonus insularis]|uniref:coiled-coil domain-containing protein 43 isoform X2 n=1 Tax=Chelonus insularis TaxID=460826 RepID=UPI00158C8B74|nr:coiled-coil domain-containing protein 43 isoform X2 [Chelonus insularis]